MLSKAKTTAMPYIVETIDIQVQMLERVAGGN